MKLCVRSTVMRLRFVYVAVSSIRIHYWRFFRQNVRTEVSGIEISMSMVRENTGFCHSVAGRLT
jgi:hypothetical protein